MKNSTKRLTSGSQMANDLLINIMIITVLSIPQKMSYQLVDYAPAGEIMQIPFSVSTVINLG